MLRSSKFLFICAALSTLVWVACSSDTGTRPHHDSSDTEATVGAGVKVIHSVDERDAGVSSLGTVEVRSGWTSADIATIRVDVDPPAAVSEGCLVMATANGKPREVLVHFDTTEDVVSLTSRNPRGEIVWKESYQVLDGGDRGYRITETGPSGFGLRWTREVGEGNRWVERFSAIGLEAPELVVTVDYDDPESVSKGLVQFGDWLPSEVEAGVFGEFEGFAIRSILRESVAWNTSGGENLARLISDEPAARSVVQKICILAGLCTGLKCTFGGGISNPVCVGCSGATIACSLCQLLEMGC